MPPLLPFLLGPTILSQISNSFCISIIASSIFFCFSFSFAFSFGAHFYRAFIFFQTSMSFFEFYLSSFSTRLFKKLCLITLSPYPAAQRRNIKILMRFRTAHCRGLIRSCFYRIKSSKIFIFQRIF